MRAFHLVQITKRRVLLLFSISQREDGCQLSRRLGLAWLAASFFFFSPSMAGDKEINAARPACSCVIDQGFVHLLGPQRTRVRVLHTHTHTHTPAAPLSRSQADLSFVVPGGPVLFISALGISWMNCQLRFV